MIWEAVNTDTAYAVLHPSVRDRVRARRFVVVDKGDAASHSVEGYFTDEHGHPVDHATELVNVRLIRSTWTAWQQGIVVEKKQYRRQPQNVAGWLRRIAADPDASNDLKKAAERQLATLV